MNEIELYEQRAAKKFALVQKLKADMKAAYEAAYEADDLFT